VSNPSTFAFSQIECVSCSIAFQCPLPLRRGGKDSVDHLPGLFLNSAEMLVAAKTLGVDLVNLLGARRRTANQPFSVMTFRPN
jgi:hypothetical protein